MASHGSAGGDRHLVDELQTAFKACISSLVAQDTVHVNDQIELKSSVEQSMQHFLELAKETENFFLQRQLRMATTKPENVIKEEVDDLKAELSRKNALLQKHQAKVTNWLGVLQSLECSAPPPLQQQQQQQHHHLQLQQQLARGTMGPQTGGLHGSAPGPSGADFQGQSLGSGGGGGGSGDGTPNVMSVTPLSGPLAHLEQATSSIGGSGFDRR